MAERGNEKKKSGKEKMPKNLKEVEKNFRNSDVSVSKKRH